MLMKEKFYEIKSWWKTVAADLITELAVGLLTGLQTLLASGDITQASIVAMASAVLTATVRSGLKKLLEYMESNK